MASQLQWMRMSMPKMRPILSASIRVLDAFPCVLFFIRINAFQVAQASTVEWSSQVTKRLLECSLTKYIATAYKLRTAIRRQSSLYARRMPLGRERIK